MKYLITYASGKQITLESENSLAHVSLAFPPTTDIQPIREELEYTPAKKPAKKAKDAS